MAKKQFQGSARAKGFRPVSLSNAAEQRIAQQTSRVVEGMRMFQDSDMKNRDRILRDMEKNAAATQRQLQRDQNIHEKNVQNEINQARSNETVRRQQAQADAAATSAMFKSVADFSDTAAKVVQEIQTKQAEEEYQDDFVKQQLLGPYTEETFKYEALKGEQEVGTAVVASEIDMAEARGANPLAVSKARLATFKGSLGSEDAEIMNTVKSSWVDYRDEQLMTSDEEIPGLGFTVREARGDTGKTAAATQFLQAKYIYRTGLSRFSGARLNKAAQWMLEQNESLLKQAAAQETARNNSLLQQDALNIFSSGDVDPLTANNAFKELVAGNKGNVIKAFDQLSDGVSKGLIEPSDLAGIIMPDGSTFGESKRYQRLEDLQTKYFIDQTNLEENERKANYKQKSNDWIKYFDENPDATIADLQTAAESYAGDPQGVPEWLRKRISYRDPSGQQQGDFLIEMADDAAGRGTLTTTLVNKVFEVDPVKGRELAAKLDKQNEFSNNDAYQEYYDSLEGLVKTQTEATDTPGSIEALRFFQKNFTQEVTKKVAGDMSIEDASREAAFEIQDKVNSNANNIESPYYRQFDPPTGQYVYPKMSTNLSGTQKAKEMNLERAQKILAAPGSKMNSLLDTPGALYNDEELQTILRDYNLSPATFKIPGTFQILADRTLQNPMTLLNRVMKNQIGKELPLTPSMELLDQASPRARQILQRHKSANRSIRGLGETSTGFNSGAIQPMYVPMIEQAAAVHAVPAPEISALIEIESGFRPEVPSYNNSSFGMMQINRSAHPEFFATQDWRDPKANINYGTKFYSDLKKQFGNDPVAAAMAYNAGAGNYQLYLQKVEPGDPRYPGWTQRKKDEMINHGRKFAKALYKYQGNSSGMLQSPSTMRAGSPLHVYTSGNIGPTSTGPHLDVKRSDRGEFNSNALDNFVEVDDPELGRVPLGQVPVTGDFASHTVRGSHGIDYGTHSGSEIYLKNGAKVVGTTPSEHGDVLTIELPDGSRYTMLHGKSAN